MRFQGKVAIVTGAGQGIGESYAKALSAEGASVVVADLNEAQAARVAAEIEAKGDAPCLGTSMFPILKAPPRWLRPPLASSAESTTLLTTRPFITA